MPATAALKALLKGPSAAERASGHSSAVPAGLKVRTLTIASGLATVHLVGPSPDTFADGRAWAEIVYTLTRFPTIRRVALTVNGRTPSPPSGGSLTALSRADFRGLEPAIFVESPGFGAVVSSPFALRGTASVFEGSFSAVLVDNSGRRIVRKQVQASQGAPGRGRFRMTIPFSTSATEGTLIVYDLSMEDGSRQNEVRIPVTFAQD